MLPVVGRSGGPSVGPSILGCALSKKQETEGFEWFVFKDTEVMIKDLTGPFIRLLVCDVFIKYKK